MTNEKVSQRDKMVYEFGVLLAPFEALAKSATPPSLLDYRTAIAAVRSGDSDWRHTVQEFTTFRPDLHYIDEFNSISHVPEHMWHTASQMLKDPEVYCDLEKLQSNFKVEFRRLKEEFSDRVYDVPVNWEPTTFTANTPFTAYLRIKEAITTGRRRIHYFDRYLKPQFYELFMAEIDRAIEVRLITTAKGVSACNAVSQTVRVEFSNYQLLEIDPMKMHDRNLRVDDLNFSLGPGTATAGMALTNFGPSDCTPAGHTALDGLIAAATIVHQS